MFLSMLGSSIKGLQGISTGRLNLLEHFELSAKPGILQVAWAHPTHRDETIFSRDS